MINIKRDLEQYLLKWKADPSRSPLLLRGARQVGKTFLIDAFGKKFFSDYIVLNFEQTPILKSCFETLEPQKIITAIEILKNKKIIVSECLLFLDEIQECPQAIMALRYFKEQLPKLHVIAAGSWLEFVLNDTDFRMPVGRIQFLYLKPLSFIEFLNNRELTISHKYLQQCTISEPFPTAIHQHLLNYVKEYALLGGMPAVVAKYLETNSMLDSQPIQSAILETYRNDFGKYARKVDYRNLQILFEKSPGLVAQWFKYTNVHPDLAPKAIRQALSYLCDAGILYQIHACNATGLPLITTRNEKKFKILFLDVGLVKRACNLDAELLLQTDLSLINQGALTEQLVGQELLAYQAPYQAQELYFWAREHKNSAAEVDYLMLVGTNIIPIEVKSGKTGRLKSLKIFMQEHKSKIGIRISQLPLSFEDNILSIPFYLISELPRLVNEALTL